MAGVSKMKVLKKRRVFAQMVYGGATLTDALRKISGELTGNEKTIRRRAYYVFNHPDVQTELKRLREMEGEQAIKSKNAKTHMLLELAEMLIEGGKDKQGNLKPANAQAAIKALETAAKMDGDLHGSGDDNRELTHLEHLQNALKKKKSGDVESTTEIITKYRQHKPQD